MKNTQEKFETVINKNTFYFCNKNFEENYEAYINSIKDSLLVLKNQIQNSGLKKELFEELIYKIDFIIPNKKNPLLMIESSYLVTTSSGQGDKSKTEIQVDFLIKKHYPKASFIGFVDGIGWYVRKNDLKRMVTAYADVFTYHQDELDRFKKLLIEVFSL